MSPVLLLFLLNQSGILILSVDMSHRAISSHCFGRFDRIYFTTFRPYSQSVKGPLGSRERQSAVSNNVGSVGQGEENTSNAL